MPEFGLGIQAWLGIGPFDPGRVEDVAWPHQPIEKPQHGFFTSSWDGRTSAWIEWQATQERGSEKRSIYLLLPDSGAVMYVIDSPDDYARLVEAYPLRRSDIPSHPKVCPHWRRLAERGPFDAIHMTCAAVADQNLLYARRWSVESTLWFRPTLVLLDQSSTR